MGSSASRSSAGKPLGGFRDFAIPATDGVDIGLINNMPDPVLQSTERQLLSLLQTSGVPVRVRLWSLPGLPRSGNALQRIAEHYEPLSSLWTSRLDALIVTGTEPRHPDLRHEPYWDAFTQVLDWARTNTISTLWSCLAAHAAVLYADGLQRRAATDKNFGLFACARKGVHPLLKGAPRRMHIPHSRWNGLDEDELRGAGYTVLTRSDEVGPDMFVKQDKSLFLFMQGHPEYDAHSLMLEYRRDVGRFLSGARDVYPNLPRHYFSARTTEALLAFRSAALSNRGEDMLSRFPMAVAADGLRNSWRPNAELIYRNWVAYIAAGKAHGPATCAETSAQPAQTWPEFNRWKAPGSILADDGPVRT